MCTQTGCTRALPVTLGAAPMANGSHGVLAKPRIQPLQSGGGCEAYNSGLFVLPVKATR